MTAPAQSLSDEQAVLDVVAYIATLEAPPSPRTEVSGNPDTDRAEALFHDCIQCHGTKAQGLDSGTPNDPRAPRLSGQDDWYLIRQMRNFQSGIRGTHKEDKEGW